MFLAGASTNAGELQPSATPIIVAIPDTGEKAQQVLVPPAELPSIALPSLPVGAHEPVSASVSDVDDAIVVTARHRPPPSDPLEVVNIKTYAAVQAVDRTIVGPAALGYKHAVPAPVRAGIRNFFNNLAEPIVSLNYLLQFKPGKAAETVGRFGLNSTIGIAGLFDVAKRKPFRLPLRRNGFANTLGYYGVKPGAFLFIPLVGPTTVRDLLGLWVDKLVLPVAVGKPFNQLYYTVPATFVGSLDYRVEFDSQLRKLHDAPDPYAASRDNYLRSRQAEIEALHSRHPPAAVLTPSGVPAPAGTMLPAAPVVPPQPAGPEQESPSGPLPAGAINP
jgi:phospholipid-binding lipoprotein MlaA